MAHSKFPIQVYRIERFIAEVAQQGTSLPVLDFGCGPGPTTKLLTAAGFRTVAVDFSAASLAIINRELCAGKANAPLLVQADLNRLRFAS